MPFTDLVHDKGELLHGGDDDFLALLQKGPQLLRALGNRADDGGYLGELLNGLSDLLVEHQAVSNHYDGVESRLSSSLQPDQLVGKPGNRIAFARTRRMLDEGAFSGSLGFSVGQQLAHHVQLMKAGEDLLRLLLLTPLVRLFDYLSIVFEDVGEVPFAQNLLPQ